jgi:hypothetical protein
MQDYKQLLIDKVFQNEKEGLAACGLYVTEMQDYGVILRHTIKKKGFVFTPNGEVHKVHNVIDEKEWDIHCDMYDAFNLANLPNYTIEQPLHFEHIIINNIKMYYYVVSRPNDLGIELIQDIANHEVTTDTFLEYIDGVTASFDIMYPVVKKHNVGFSGEVLSPYKRYRNQLGQYCWGDFKVWDCTLPRFYAKKIRTLYMLATAASINYENFNINIDIDVKQIMNVAENKWKNLREFS